MSATGLRRHGRMGEKAMRITVVGAVLIAAAVIAAVLLVRALKDMGDHSSQKYPDPEGPVHP